MDTPKHVHTSVLTDADHDSITIAMKRVIKAANSDTEICSLGVMHAVRDTPEVAALTPQAALEVGYAVGRMVAEQEQDEMQTAITHALKAFAAVGGLQ